MVISTDTILLLFLVFCRIGAFIMVLPGFASAQVPMQFRLFIAIGISFALFPLVNNAYGSTLSADTASFQLKFIGFELLVGLGFGLLVRLFMSALLFLGEVITQMIGLSIIPSAGMDDVQPTTSISTLLQLAAIMIIFVTGMHTVLILGVADTYELIPVGQPVDMSALMTNLIDNAALGFYTVTQLGAPFFLYAVAMNMMAGLVNKLSPQIPVYFVTAPVLIFGGVLLLMWVSDGMLIMFVQTLGRAI